MLSARQAIINIPLLSCKQEDKNMSQAKQFKKSKKHIIFVFALVLFCSALHAQTDFPGGGYWSFDAGAGMTDILVKGLSYQAVIDPKLWLSPAFMLGNKSAVNYSTDHILAFETQVYLRWNFLRLGPPEKQVTPFFQGGMGMLAAYKDQVFGNPTNNRGSLMFDAATGITIPLGSRWHIEPSVRGGYPHIAGFSLTAGYKFPFPQKGKSRGPSSNDIIKRIHIASFDTILFGPDTEQYNADVDPGTRDLNDRILNSTAEMLKEHPEFRVRIEGHANPVTKTSGEAARLMVLSRKRADVIAGKLREKGVKEEQMVITAFGGTRIISYDTRNINRRVELIVVQVNNEL
jgi:outer membrane protein OmpA-like peptidoglycan-associated protein